MDIIANLDEHECKVDKIIHNECVVIGFPEWIIKNQLVHFNLYVTLEKIEHHFHIDGKVININQNKFFIRFINPIWMNFFIKHRSTFEYFKLTK